MQIGQRFAALQIAHPEHLDLVFHCEGGAREEEALHRQFAAYRVRGEWFRIDREILDWIVRQKEAEHAR